MSLGKLFRSKHIESVSSEEEDRPGRALRRVLGPVDLILLAMSRDGLLPPGLARIHPKFRTPHVATIATGVFSADRVGNALTAWTRNAGAPRQNRSIRYHRSGFDRPANLAYVCLPA